MKDVEEPSDQGIRVNVHDLLHYQSLARQLQFPLQNIPSTSIHGNKQTKIKGRGMTFTDLRQYERGDDIRLIDWRVTARLGAPHTRQYDEDKSQPHLVFIDFAESLFFGSKNQLKSVLAAKLAATIIWQIHLQGEPSGLLTSKTDNLEFIAPSTSERHLFKCLSQLAKQSLTDTNLKRSANKQQENRLSQALQLLLSNLQSGSVVILISDFIHWPSAMLELCHRISARGQMLIYEICDPIESDEERKVKDDISLLFTDGITTQKRTLDATQNLVSTFLNHPSLKHHHQVNVSTHLNLRDQLLGRRQSSSLGAQ